MRHPAAVLGELLVRLESGAGRDFSLDPVFEGGLLGDFAGGAEARDDGGGVVALGVGEVAEVEAGLDARVVGGEEDAAAAAGARDVGCHAEGVLGGVVPEARGVVDEGDLVAVHHDVCDVAVAAGRVGDFAAQEDAGIGVLGRLVGGHGFVEFPHDD